MKHKITWKFALTMAVLLLLLGSGVYAWIYGNAAPKLYGEFQIGKMKDMNFTIDTTQHNLANLNNTMGISVNGLNLNEVSSADGKTFFARDMSELYFESGNTDGNKEIITFREAQPNVLTTTVHGYDIVRTVSGDYLDVSFQLLLHYGYVDPNVNYYFYFLNGTMDGKPYTTGFTKSTSPGDDMKALRACLRISGATAYGAKMTQDGDTGTYWAIFGNVAEPDGENHYHTQAVAATERVGLRRSRNNEATTDEDIAGTYTIDYLPGYTGRRLYGTLQSEIPVCCFADCGLNPSDYDDNLNGGSIPSVNYLFMTNTTDGDRAVNVTLRVWLEGGSDYCTMTNITPDDEISISLNFVAYCVSSG